MAKNSKAKSVAKPSGTNDFKDKAQKKVEGDGPKAKTSGHTNDFAPGKGEKAVGSGGGDQSEDTDAYKTEKKAQSGPSSDF